MTNKPNELPAQIQHFIAEMKKPGNIYARDNYAQMLRQIVEQINRELEDFQKKYDSATTVTGPDKGHKEKR